MVGLSVVLEPTAAKNDTVSCVINKAMLMTITKPSSSSSSPPQAGKGQRRHPPPPDFLDRCFLCKNKLLPGMDIYMYKGDRGFCSVECRCRQMYMDDDEEGFGSCRRSGTNGNKSRPAGGFAY